MSFRQSYPQCPAAISLDEILKENNETKYSRNINSIIATSMRLFKEVSKVNFLTDLVLGLCYKNRCEAVEALKVSPLTKEHIKCIIHSGYSKHLPLH